MGKKRHFSPKLHDYVLAAVGLVVGSIVPFFLTGMQMRQSAMLASTPFSPPSPMYLAQANALIVIGIVATLLGLAVFAVTVLRAWREPEAAAETGANLDPRTNGWSYARMAQEHLQRSEDRRALREHTSELRATRLREAMNPANIERRSEVQRLRARHAAGETLAKELREAATGGYRDGLKGDCDEWFRQTESELPETKRAAFRQLGIHRFVDTGLARGRLHKIDLDPSLAYLGEVIDDMEGSGVA